MNLTPEDIKVMKDAIAMYEGSGSMNPDVAADTAGDALQDRKMLQALVSAMEAIIDEVEKLKACHEELERMVKDEIIGGVTKLYNENLRLDGISGIKGKYGEQFQPYEGVFQALVDDPNADLYANLYDKLESMKSDEGFSEETGHDYVMSILEKLKGSAPAPAVSVEVEKVEEVPTEEEALVTRLRNMKKKAGSAGTF